VRPIGGAHAEVCMVQSGRTRTTSATALAPVAQRRATPARLALLLLVAALAACSDAKVGDGGPQTSHDEWRFLGGSLSRTYYNAGETEITKDTAPRLVLKWRFVTGAIVTAQPVVARVDLPGEPDTEVVYIASWDGKLYALRGADGSLAWSFAFKPHPGASYPAASSAAVEDIDGRRTVFVGGGMTMYALDAATGAKLWEFDAGTGCTTCDSTVERNQIESSPAVFDGLVYFGMDVNDSAGKGGFYAVDARTGTMRWFFDLASGSSCRPDAGDDVRRFDGYHTAAQLGLREDFFATRPGCSFDRTPNTCGNVWSSATIDVERKVLFTASSNCDSDTDPTTVLPSPVMPPYDEAVFALHTDSGEPVWRWRPREVDPNDLSFGAVPNLFEIELGGATREVIGIGNKDGNYYVLDRDGVNQVTGVIEPYWSRRVVEGGSIGGLIASAAVGDGKVLFSTAIGTDISNPQTPAAWGLDAASGNVLWNNPEAQPSYSASSAVPGVVFMGSLSGTLYAYDADTGVQLAALSARGPLGSAATIVGGTVFVGAGTGERGSNPTSIEYLVSLQPSPVSAFCIAGTEGCPDSAGCDDGNACTLETQSGATCDSVPAPDGTACAVGDLSGQCQAGACILEGATCPDVSQCTRPDPHGSQCRYAAEPDGTACTTARGAGQCLAGNCIGS
jgi:polyvinyl alcohol dehydrogenase (cytochrome)